ncbi:molybdenum cofactor biosynthesis protein MoaE [Rhizobiaceae bacterium BDR2-2]|uniref:Molybdopterin synthase catalytic subunit n=1 Tax=Ectorhizobium quercum TaxID=2965071 RepID=A0AAE3N1F6_9HYPH|nr:molybdenum cofactor biosynthesis protein MoaE [Ectorhizobium quercum]MCX8999013.1 molybdenum cofactor biosynthesis protein MoaE [Ectorhizobium quercum]
MAIITTRVQSQDFDAAAEYEALRAGTPGAGALVSFTGLCRDEGGRLSALELEHYPGMAEKALERIARAAAARFGLLGLAVVHRHGVIPAGGNIVLVIAAAGHRKAAFEAASFVMDHLKTDAPFWKKEHGAEGEGAWVEARRSDDAERDQWNDAGS